MPAASTTLASAVTMSETCAEKVGGGLERPADLEGEHARPAFRDGGDDGGFLLGRDTMTMAAWAG